MHFFAHVFPPGLVHRCSCKGLLATDQFKSGHTITLYIAGLIDKYLSLVPWSFKYSLTAAEMAPQCFGAEKKKKHREEFLFLGWGGGGKRG